MRDGHGSNLADSIPELVHHDANPSSSPNDDNEFDLRDFRDQFNGAEVAVDVNIEQAVIDPTSRVRSQTSTARENVNRAFMRVIAASSNYNPERPRQSEPEPESSITLWNLSATPLASSQRTGHYHSHFEDTHRRFLSRILRLQDWLELPV
jgi:hypothetical protein